MSQEKEPPKIIAAKKTSEADQSWIKHQREVQQKTPERIEDAATLAGQGVGSPEPSVRPEGPPVTPMKDERR